MLKLPNGATTWTRVIGTSTGSCSTSTDMVGIDIKKSSSGDLYATTIDYSTGTPIGKIWKSIAGSTAGNAGTWTNITPAGSFDRIELDCSATNNSKVYAILANPNTTIGGVRLTTNGGSSWSTIDIGNWCDAGTTKTDFTRGQAWYDLAIASAPGNDKTVFAGGVVVFGSSNSGASWSQTTSWASGCSSLAIVHADIHAIKFFPGSTSEFIVSCDGGIYYTSDGGTTFTNKNSSYNVTQYYGLAIHPSAGSNFMLAGAQDNGTHKFGTSGVNSVTQVVGGDGGNCFIDGNNPNYQFASTPGADVYFSANSGSSFGHILSASADRFINPSDYDSLTDFYYCGGDQGNFIRLYKCSTTPTADEWTLTNTANLSVSAIKVDPNTPNRLWIAFSTADQYTAPAIPELYILDNSNDSNAFVLTPVTLPAEVAGNWNYISSIDVEPGNANHVIFTLSNYGVNSIWESTDRGATWGTLDNSTLPDMPVRFVKFLPSGSNPGSKVASVGGILLATEMGIWSTNNILGIETSWMPNNSGMGNVRADRIEFRSSDKTIGIATHGRGVFTGTFISSLPINLISFTGVLNKNIIGLNWKTGSELNARDFEVEKSTDGTRYYKIGVVPAVGNSFTLLRYGFDDPDVHEINYYRLRMNDMNGKSRLSSIVLVRNNYIEQKMRVVNPFDHEITISLTKKPDKVKLELFMLNGVKIMEKSFTGNSDYIQWQLADKAFAKGVYLLHAIVDQHSYTFKLYKQ